MEERYVRFFEKETDRKYRNFYKCERCGEKWEDEWSSMSDDECPKCKAKNMTPYKSEELKEEKEVEEKEETLKESLNDLKVGDTGVVSEGSGLASNQKVTVINWFPWEKATDGTYSAPDPKRYYAVKYENGKIGFMPKSRVLAI